MKKDKGYAWFIVLGCCIMNALVMGFKRSGAILFIEAEHALNANKKDTGLTMAIGNSLTLFMSPIANILVSLFGTRKVVFLGAVIYSGGLFASRFVDSVLLLDITYGVLSGIGSGLCYSPSFVMVGQYFEKRRALANGLSVAGSGIGAFALAPLLDLLITEYGYHSTWIVLSGISLNLCVCGVLYRPFESEPVKLTVEMEIMPMCDEEEKLTKEEKLGMEEKLAEEEKLVMEEKRTKEQKFTMEEKLTKEQKFAMEEKHTNEEKLAMEEKLVMEEKRTKEQKLTMEEKLTKEEKHTNEEKLAMEEKPSQSNSFLKLFNYKLLKNPPFILFLFISCFCGLSYTCNYYIAARAIELGYTETDAALLLAISGASDLVGRVISGVISDRKSINRKLLFKIYFLTGGAALIVLPFFTSLWIIYCCVIVMALSSGMNVTLIPVVLIDILGFDNFSTSFGLTAFTNAVGLLVGPPVAGWLIDSTGRVDSALFFCGSTLAISGLIAFLEPCARKLEKHCCPA